MIIVAAATIISIYLPRAIYSYFTIVIIYFQ